MEKPVIPRRGPYAQPATAGTFFWCSCGRSAQQPFCDGAHKGIGLAPLKVDLAQAGTVAWCGCKHSKTGAFCDGSHRALA